jgi:hypothetical protein
MAQLSEPEPIRIVAEFGRPTDAQAAMIDLEARGFDADDVHLPDPGAVPTPEMQRTAEGRVMGRVLKRAVLFGTAGAVVGAAIGLLLVWALDADFPMAPGIAVLAGGLFGGAIAGLWGAAYRLPVNEEAFDADTVDARDTRPVRVEVRARSREDAARASDVLQARGANLIDPSGA